MIRKPILSDGLILKVNIHAIKNKVTNLSRLNKTGHAKGHYVYRAGDGITNVSHLTVDGDLYGVILTTNQLHEAVKNVTGWNQKRLRPGRWRL